MNVPYKYTAQGVKYIPDYTSFSREYLNELAYSLNLKSNRVFGTELQLPYTKSDVEVKFNEQINSLKINSIVEKLYTNYVYILTQCKIYNTDSLPEFRGSSSIPSSIYNAPYIEGQYKTSYTPVTGDTLLQNGVKTLLLTNHRTPGVYSMVIATNNRLILGKFQQIKAKGKAHQITIISNSESERLVDSENDMLFKSIKKVVTDGKGYIYTLDTGRTIIYKHNIRGLTNDDNILLTKETKGRMLEIMVGTKGSVSSKTRFNNPMDMIYYKNNIYVLDNDVRNYQVKVYDEQLNWVSTFNLSLDFVVDDPINIVANNDLLYILTEQGRVYIYDIPGLYIGNWYPVKVVDLKIIDTDYNKVERYVELNFSTINSNVCYVLTNKNIYKKVVDQLELTAGTVEWSKRQICTGKCVPETMTIVSDNTELKDVALVVANVDIDNHPHKNSERNILHFTDPDKPLELIDFGYEQDILTLEDCKVAPEEYVSSFVYNKLVAKMLYNINLIYNNLLYVPTSEINSSGERLYTGTRYIPDVEVSEYRLDRDAVVVSQIGINELVSSAVINRCMSLIITAQHKVLDLIKTKVNPPEFYKNRVNVLKSSPVPVVESHLETGYTYRIQKL